MATPFASAHASPRQSVSAVVPAPVDPSRWYYRYGYVRAARWLSRYHRTRVYGAPRPVGPCIYVAHHGAGYLVLDLVIAGYELAWRDWYEHRAPAVALRIVASRDNALERAIPGLAAAKRHVGIIDPSAEAAITVLERGEQLLITPGGRREATPAARNYRLRWTDRFGFVRLALRTGAPIVPLAVVGGFEAYPGIARGRLSLWSPVPLPVRLDLVVGSPIPVARRPNATHDREMVAAIHREAWHATQTLYDRVLALRTRK